MYIIQRGNYFSIIKYLLLFRSVLTADVMGRTACHLAAAKGQFKVNILVSLIALDNIGVHIFSNETVKRELL